MLPDGDGLAICAALRQRPETANLPVIMLTAQGDPHSRVLGLELGADDYVAKPFEPRELVARIKAVLRRRSAPGAERGGDGSVEFAGWRFDRLKRQLLSPQQVVVPLSSAEYRLLSAFVERPRRVLTRDQLLDATRGQGVVVADRAIDLAVSRLRQKLSAAQDGEQLICTIRGEGYIFDAEGQRAQARFSAIVARSPPSARLASVSTPPWRATRSRAMYSPSPLPPVRRLREVSRR